MASLGLEAKANISSSKLSGKMSVYGIKLSFFTIALIYFTIILGFEH